MDGVILSCVGSLLAVEVSINCVIIVFVRFRRIPVKPFLHWGIIRMQGLWDDRDSGIKGG